MLFSWNASEDNRLGTDKTTLHSYGPVYERLIKDLKDREVPGALMEIGVLSGASVVNLHQAFPERVIYGLDIDLSNVLYQNAGTDSIKWIQMDATDVRESTRLPITERFALIIDDGSHLAADILAAFVLWGPKVEKGGYYVIEDLTEEVALEIGGLLLALGNKWGFHWKTEDLRHIKGRHDDIIFYAIKIR
jgi:Methyltransferase domain